MNKKWLIILDCLLLPLAIYLSFYPWTWKYSLSIALISPFVSAVFIILSFYVLVKSVIKKENRLIGLIFILLILYILAFAIIPEFLFRT